MTAQRPERCPRCRKKRIAQYLYGLVYPDEKMQAGLESGDLILGGCVVDDSSPGWRCRACGHEWGENDMAPHFQKSREAAAKEEAQAEADAMARGVMTAKVNSAGYARCPHCGISFSTKYKSFWDGTRHTTCRTYLKLEGG